MYKLTALEGSAQKTSHERFFNLQLQLHFTSRAPRKNYSKPRLILVVNALGLLRLVLAVIWINLFDFKHSTFIIHKEIEVQSNIIYNPHHKV